MQKTLILSCALILAGLSTSAMAAEGQGFVRAEVGNSDVDFDIAGLGSGSDDGTSYSVRGGYYFNSNFAVEGAYSSLYDEAGDKLSSFGVGVVGKKNLGVDNSGFFFSGRLGVERVKGELNGLGSDTSNNLYYGFGAGYDFSDSFGLGVNYDIRNADFEGVDADAKTLSIAGEFRF